MTDGVRADLALALGSLGYSKGEIQRVVAKVTADAGADVRVETLLRVALRELGPTGGRRR